jgi:hypothetical protein
MRKRLSLLALIPATLVFLLRADVWWRHLAFALVVSGLLVVAFTKPKNVQLSKPESETPEPA